MFTCYISHSIQGRFGSKATDEQMRLNCQRAIQFTGGLRAVFESEIDFYLPAEHEAFVHRAYRMGLLSVDEVLLIDCDIVASKDILLLYIPDCYVSRGMIKEAARARSLGIPILQVNNENWKTVIQEFLDDTNNKR